MFSLFDFLFAGVFSSPYDQTSPVRREVLRGEALNSIHASQAFCYVSPDISGWR